MQVSYFVNGERRSGRLTKDHKIETFGKAVLLISDDDDDDELPMVPADDVDYIVVPQEPTDLERSTLRAAHDFGYKLRQNGADWTPPRRGSADYI